MSWVNGWFYESHCSYFCKLCGDSVGVKEPMPLQGRWVRSSGVLEPTCTREALQHVFPTPWSAILCLWLDIGFGEIIYTVKLENTANQCFPSPQELVVKHLPVYLKSDRHEFESSCDQVGSCKLINFFESYFPHIYNSNNRYLMDCSKN